jgi:Zn-dependent protease
VIARRGIGGPGGINPLLILAVVFAVANYRTIFARFDQAIGDPVGFWSFIVALLLGITFHEFMHAYVAHRLGDDTGRLMGRMSLNPLAHLDLFGSLFMFIVGFGYAKPVPVNESRLRGGRSSMALVAIAGPLTNAAIALVCAIPARFSSADLGSIGSAYDRALIITVVYNLFLGVFNLIPIPPLDGSKLVYGFLSPSQAYNWHTYEQYGPFILLFVFLFAFQLVQQFVVVPSCGIASFLIGPGACRAF